MSATEKVNILMVDDHPDKLLTYEVILRELGENLIKATSGREALEQLLKNDVAVVLLDVSMPIQDGFELAHTIRQHPRFEKTAIIFISAVHVTDVDRLTGFEQGAVDYISVPIVPRLLRARVRVFVELYRKTRELERLNGELRRVSSHLIRMQDEERHQLFSEESPAAKEELHKHLSAVRMFPSEDGEGWYYIAEGTWDLLGTDPLAPDVRVREEGRIRMVAGGGFEPLRRVDYTQVIDFTISENSERRSTRGGTGHGQDTDAHVFCPRHLQDLLVSSFVRADLSSIKNLFRRSP
jgi:DNA-binding response OmpR family regulator